MHKKILSLAGILLSCLLLAGCGIPEEKIEQAQEKYAQLAEIHNQAVEAHKNVEDSSLDEALTNLQSRVSGMGAYNLAEMEEEEIDRLIQDMEMLIKEYEDSLARLSGIKSEEEEAVLTPIVITLINRTEISFSGLRLYEEGSGGVQVNVLEDMETFIPEQYLTGLMVMRDVRNTPWIIALTDENGVEYELSLAVEEYGSEKVSLELRFDSEQGGLKAVLAKDTPDGKTEEPKADAEGNDSGGQQEETEDDAEDDGPEQGQEG